MNYQRLRARAGGYAAPSSRCSCRKWSRLPRRRGPGRRGADLLASIGLEIEPFGEGSIAIKALPPPSRASPNSRFAALLADLSDELVAPRPRRVAGTAARRAPRPRRLPRQRPRPRRAHAPGGAGAARRARRHRLRRPLRHGRPVVAELADAPEIERRFGRDYASHSHAAAREPQTLLRPSRGARQPATHRPGAVAEACCSRQFPLRRPGRRPPRYILASSTRQSGGKKCTSPSKASSKRCRECRRPASSPGRSAPASAGRVPRRAHPRALPPFLAAAATRATSSTATTCSSSSPSAGSRTPRVPSTTTPASSAGSPSSRGAAAGELHQPRRTRPRRQHPLVPNGRRGSRGRGGASTCSRATTASTGSPTLRRARGLACTSTRARTTPASPTIRPPAPRARFRSTTIPSGASWSRAGAETPPVKLATVSCSRWRRARTRRRSPRAQLPQGGGERGGAGRHPRRPLLAAPGADSGR